ncbi:unnamed protein product [Somion occarium]|uniref:Zn(2)-C6 fungal-type domain-containing protein n=1 Tax=Somion occarium TaxID=3059160 RepID=A0ABP1DRE8_9APHY
MDAATFSQYGSYQFDTSRRGNDSEASREPFAYLHAHAQQLPISTESSLTFALGMNVAHVRQTTTYAPAPQYSYNATKTFAMTDDQCMCPDGDEMSCVEYGESEFGGYDSPYSSALSPSSSVDYTANASYWGTPPPADYFDGELEHAGPSSAFDRPLYPPTRSYTLESAITPITPTTPVTPSSTVSSSVRIGTVSTPREDRHQHTTSSSAPETSARNSRPNLAPVKTDFTHHSHSHLNSTYYPASTTSAAATVPDNTPLSLAAIASQLNGSGMDEIPVSESEAKLGQAMFKLHGAVPPPKDQPAKKKPIMACLFCRERKICCGPPPPDSLNQTCKQCSRRGLDCVFPTESRRGQHKRSPRAARVAALADAHLHKLAHAQSQVLQGHPQPPPPDATLAKKRPAKPRVLKSKADEKASMALVNEKSVRRRRSPVSEVA